MMDLLIHAVEWSIGGLIGALCYLSACGAFVVAIGCSMAGLRDIARGRWRALKPLGSGLLLFGFGALLVVWCTSLAWRSAPTGFPTVAVAATLLLAVVIIIAHAVLLPRGRRRFCSSREAMDDETFATHVNAAPADLEIVSLIRRVFAAQCQVPPEMIYHTDDCGYLDDELIFNALDVVRFASDLATGLRRPIARSAETGMPRYKRPFGLNGILDWLLEGRLAEARMPCYGRPFGTWVNAVLEWLKANGIVTRGAVSEQALESGRW
jgi:hypothetical protein